MGTTQFEALDFGHFSIQKDVQPLMSFQSISLSLPFTFSLSILIAIFPFLLGSIFDYRIKKYYTPVKNAEIVPA